MAIHDRLGKHPRPDVLASAGTSVFAFHKPDLLGDHSFPHPQGCSKGREPMLSADCGQGFSDGPKRRAGVTLILSETAGA